MRVNNRDRSKKTDTRLTRQLKRIGLRFLDPMIQGENKRRERGSTLRAAIGTIERQSTSLIAIVNRGEPESGRKSDGFFPRRKNGDVALVKRPAGFAGREIRVARANGGHISRRRATRGGGRREGKKPLANYAG